MRKSLIVAGLLLAALFSTLVAAPAQAASSGFQFTTIAFNPPGADTGSAASLNAEYVDIKNVTSRRHSLDGWRVSDLGSDHKYYVPTYVTVDAGKLVRIHTGHGVNHKASSGNWHLYMRLDNYVWNNGGDKAVLRSAGGTLKDTCAYSGSARSPKIC